MKLVFLSLLLLTACCVHAFLDTISVIITVNGGLERYEAHTLQIVFSISPGKTKGRFISATGFIMGEKFFVDNRSIDDKTMGNSGVPFKVTREEGANGNMLVMSGGINLERAYSLDLEAHEAWAVDIDDSDFTSVTKAVLKFSNMRVQEPIWFGDTAQGTGEMRYRVRLLDHSGFRTETAPNPVPITVVARIGDEDVIPVPLGDPI